MFKCDVNLEGIKDEKVCHRLLIRQFIANNLIHPFVLLMNFVIVSIYVKINIQGGTNMTGTDLYVNKPYCAAAVRP